MHIKKTVTVTHLYQTNRRFVSVTMSVKEPRPIDKYPDNKEEVLTLDLHVAPGEEPQIGDQFAITIERLRGE